MLVNYEVTDILLGRRDYGDFKGDEDDITCGLWPSGLRFRVRFRVLTAVKMTMLLSLVMPCRLVGKNVIHCELHSSKRT
jgi:hypothetical protein